ncbi:MAG: P-type conjugative transfer ATPase TrbB [Gammaproteobacteria bacterium]|nr:P-type conjugative transfer ATPase TrbB [Gammaproteobacteria bacterium]
MVVESENILGSIRKHDRLVTKLRRELREFAQYLDDPVVTEIMLNSDGRVWVQKSGAGAVPVGTMSANQAQAFLSSVAASLNEIVTREDPRINGVLAIDGSRISGQISPISQTPTFTIRKHDKTKKRLDFFINQGVMTPNQHSYICRAIEAKKNIVVVGSTGSGKTFLTNALLHELSCLCPHDRVLTIEDVCELNVSSENYVSWYTSPTVDLRGLLHESLRAKPDRIVVGEVRGGECYQMLKLWNTGHSGGFSTIHANRGLRDGLSRLELMCAESPETAGLGSEWIRRLVAEVVDVLVVITYQGGKRKLENLVEVVGVDDHCEYLVNAI